MENLMFQSADCYHMNLTQGTAQRIESYTVYARGVPCSIQPMSSGQALFYQQRGLENMTSIYTTRTDLDFKRQDIIEYKGHQYHVVGIKNAIMVDEYIALDCTEYPDDAKKVLDRGQA